MTTKSATPITDKPEYNNVGAPVSFWVKHARAMERDRARLVEALAAALDDGDLCEVAGDDWLKVARAALAAVKEE